MKYLYQVNIDDPGLLDAAVIDAASGETVFALTSEANPPAYMEYSEDCEGLLEYLLALGVVEDGAILIPAASKNTDADEPSELIFFKAS